MDRATGFAGNQRAVSTDLCGFPARAGQNFARTQHAAFHKLAEGHARFGAFRWRGGEGFFVELAHLRDAFLGHLAIGLFTLDADEVTAQHLRNGAGGASTKERIKDHVSGVGGADQNAMQQGFGFLGGVCFVAVFVFQALVACANRQNPVGTHLNTFVQRLQGFIVKCVLGAFGFRGPDHRFMRVGKALAAEVRHRVRLAPDDVVQDPIALVLQLGAHPEHVVIRADDPNRTVWF